MGSEQSVLIFGGTGQVGQALLRQRGRREAVALGRDSVDVTDPAGVEAVLEAKRPGSVINCAVFQPVDACESDLRQAFAVNASAPGSLAAQCAERGLRLIHLSTDYVFDGDARQPYAEDACPNPINVYAASKLAGEHLVLAASPRHAVVRTSSVYGPASPGRGTVSFVERMLQRARDGELTRVVTDQTVSPTYADDLAAGLWKLLTREFGGVAHMAGSREATWYEVAERVFEAADRGDLLRRTTAAEFGAAAPRPSYSALRSNRLEQIGIQPLAGIDDGIERFFATVYPDLS